MSYVALISSIENLADYEWKLEGVKVKTCGACGAIKFESTKKFKNFVDKYFDSESTLENRLLNKLYSRRSEITHAGELLYNDFAETELDHNGINELNTMKLIVRVILINWLRNKSLNNYDSLHL